MLFAVLTLMIPCLSLCVYRQFDAEADEWQLSGTVPKHLSTLILNIGEHLDELENREAVDCEANHRIQCISSNDYVIVSLVFLFLTTSRSDSNSCRQGGPTAILYFFAWTRQHGLQRLL